VIRGGFPLFVEIDANNVDRANNAKNIKHSSYSRLLSPFALMDPEAKEGYGL